MTDLKQYSHHYSITAADMDTRYRITPNAVLLYYQDCWARYMAGLRLAAFDIVKRNLMWVITEFDAWFETKTALWSDDIEVTVWNSEIGTLRLYAEFRVRKSDASEVAHGYGCWTLLDTNEHRLAPFTPLLPELPVFPEVTTDTHKKRVFLSDGTLLQQIDHRVNPINLDFNGHVNNRTYLSIAMQTADEDFLSTHTIRCLTIRWLKETFLGDTLQCRLFLLPQDDDKNLYRYLHTISRNDEQTAAQVYSEWIPGTDHIDVSKQAKRE